MKENPDIEGLLNSFIDDELPARQRLEVQRLIAHNAQIAKRLRELQSCKMLVGSLPRDEAPAEMAGQIKTILCSRKAGALEKTPLPAFPQSVVAQHPSGPSDRTGARHLLARRLIAAAAMIGLIAVLAVTVYTIVAPEGVTERPVAAYDWQPTHVPEPVPEGAELLLAASRMATFNGRLELKTTAPAVVDAVISRAIEQNGLWVSATSRPDKSEYAIVCSREGLNLLLADLKNVWTRFDSATLFVSAEAPAEQVVVDAVTAGQLAEIVNQDSFAGSVKLAKAFAALNRMAELLPGRELLAAIDEKAERLITIPKPVLTSSQRATETPAGPAEDAEKICLTVVVTAGK